MTFGPLENILFTQILRNSKATGSRFNLPAYLSNLNIPLFDIGPFGRASRVNFDVKKKVYEYVSQHVFSSIITYLEDGKDEVQRGAFFYNELPKSIIHLYMEDDFTGLDEKKVSESIRQGIIANPIYKKTFSSLLKTYNNKQISNQTFLKETKLNNFMKIHGDKIFRDDSSLQTSNGFRVAFGYNIRSNIYYFDEEAAILSTKKRAIIKKNIQDSEKNNNKINSFSILHSSEKIISSYLKYKETETNREIKKGSSPFSSFNTWEERLKLIHLALKYDGAKFSTHLSTQSPQKINFILQPLTIKNLTYKQQRENFFYDIRTVIIKTLHSKFYRFSPVITTKELSYALQSIFNEQLGIDNPEKGVNYSLLSSFFFPREELINPKSSYRTFLKNKHVDVKELSQLYVSSQHKLFEPLESSDVAFFTNPQKAIDYVYDQLLKS